MIHWQTLRRAAAGWVGAVNAGGTDSEFAALEALKKSLLYQGFTGEF